MSEDNDNHGNEWNIVNLSSSAVSTTLKEHDAFDEGDKQGIDLNKTPQQKTPKRRKHQPKVVLEGKPKRTPKPKAQENVISNETPSGKRKYARKNVVKISETQQPNDVGQVCAEGSQDVRRRKYVRKKSLNTPKTQQENVVDEVRAPAGDPATKSCRRALNFDLESVLGDENQDLTSCNLIERNQEDNGGFDLNFSPQDTESCTGIKSASQASVVHIEQLNGYIAGTSNLQCSSNQSLFGSSLLSEASAPTTPLGNIKAHALNAIARNVTMRNSMPGHNAQLNGYTQVDRHASREALGQIFFNADSSCANLDRAREPILLSTSQLFTKDMPNVDCKRGLKRQSFDQIYPHALNATQSPFMYQKMMWAAIESSKDSDSFDSICLETTKKKRMQDGLYPNISTSLSGVMAVKESPRLEERRGTNGIHAKISIPQFLSSYCGTDIITDKVTNPVNVTTGNGFLHPMAAKQNLQKHHVGSELQPYMEQMAIKSSQRTQVHDFNSLTAMVTRNQLPTTPKDADRPHYWQERTQRANWLEHRANVVDVHQHLPTTPTKKAPRSDYLQEIRTCQANVLEHKQALKPSSTNQRGMDKMLHQHHKMQKHHVGSELEPCTERMARKRSQGTQVHEFNSLTAMGTWNQLPTTPPKDANRPDFCQELRTQRANWLEHRANVVDVHQHFPTTPTKKAPRPDYLQEIRTCQANVLEHKQAPKPSSSNQKGMDKMLQQQHKMQKHNVGSELQPYTEQMAIKRSEGTPVHDFNSLTAMGTWNQLPTTPPKDADRPDYWQKLRTQHANWLEHRGNVVDVHQHLPTTPTKKAPRSDYLQEIRTCQANAWAHKQVPKSSSTNQRGMDKMLQQQHNNAVEGHQPSSTKARGTPKKQKYIVLVDEITYRLEGLNISGDSKEQHSLVLHKGNNLIVPFEPKKRKPRPKVDLDLETDRLWKLLMGKEGSEGAEAMDSDKEKWWEEEREVFRGRADSFIARMHLVQGDRRFSRWKGSVVDSVIGVFLTQNVSDHLSSSAFMSLAAKFLPQSTINNEACCLNRTQVLVEEPNIQILEHSGSIKYHEKIGRQPLYNHSSILACESTEDKRHFTSGATDAENEHNRIPEEELISQDSFDSFIFQTADEQRSNSRSNSEAEDQTTGCCKLRKNLGSTLMYLLHPEKHSMFEGFYSHGNGSTMLEERATHMQRLSENQECNKQNPRFIGGNNLKSSSRFTSLINSSIFMQEALGSSSHFQLKITPDSRKAGAQYGGMSAEESLSSFPSIASGVNGPYNTSNQTYQQSDMHIPRAPAFVNYGFLSKHPSHQGSFQPGLQIGNSLNSLNYQQQQISKTHQLERAFLKEPVDPAETLAKKETETRKQGSDKTKFRGAKVNTENRMPVVDKHNCFENATAETNSKEQTYSSHEPLGVAATNNGKTKKGRAEDEKRAFDWDSLRKQVLLNGEKRERSKDAVDSLNYEALRCADVNKISDAIRQRGMNNMLAERIKDFLNRLVRDHERIDLEWLRDVPPDKAKDYLLSIWGLGLKSVECVRLLTLHHLAFPVDTNVGRIAVRLGWVPLQPLPESLQLHLLELYPVLESIQKYLWPRLCKLDQPTLYELHYQMITFGKVFCTKSKPNCNACPMRAECRHFASAFASARLALPGPEEKSIVSSAIPIVDDRKPKEGIKPLFLPSAENNSHIDAGFFERCEPIIEEPSTPQSETTEISERDIEDAFYEDPDEIPTIKLNMEEFTTNLQNLMQGNMELQGDMSRALVALNPEAASIPTPKLKNISRLRTEHRVYELPDSHPLLDGLDNREPDDPSPYLLAIWTPGETANAAQPPDSMCWAQESGNLCDDKTCFSCNNTREANSQTVRGTLLVPCRTAMRGSFPLNGTYFQVNENRPGCLQFNNFPSRTQMFADHESSMTPIDVPRTWLWNLPRRTVFFGTSVSTIFKGLTTDEIQFCFWRGFVCVRGFDQKSRAPRPLMARLHFPASKLVKKKNEGK